MKKIHRAIKFSQKDWLKPVTKMNTGLRQEAKNDFEKDYFKIMNSNVWKDYGKYEKKIEILNLSQKKEETI